MRDRLSNMIQSAVDGCAKYWANVIADKLLAEGVIVPPCKVGDRIYYIDSTNFIDCEVVKQVSINHHGEWLVLLDHSCIGFDEIGKTVFLTRSEAEQALAERSENESRKD